MSLPASEREGQPLFHWSFLLALGLGLGALATVAPLLHEGGPNRSRRSPPPSSLRAKAAHPPVTEPSTSARRPDAWEVAMREGQETGAWEGLVGLSQERLRERPEDPVLLRRHIELALARGRPREGLDASRRLTAALPASRSARALRARVAEWSGRPREALEVWWSLAERADDLEARQASERLARMLLDSPRLERLLRWRLAAQGFDFELGAELVSLLEAQGRPESALQLLLRGCRRLDAPKSWWLRRARLETQLGELEAARESWVALGGRYVLNDRELVEWAQLSWRLRGPQEALRTIGARLTAETAPVVADAAYAVGQTKRALRALRFLREHGLLSGIRTARALRLLRAEGYAEEALGLVEASLREEPRVDVLLLGMEAGLALGALPRVRGLLRVSPFTTRAAAHTSAYWRLRAWLAQLEDRPREALQALEALLRIDPGASRAQIDLLWLLMELGDRPRLRAWLPLIKARAQDAGGSYELGWALGVAHIVLGEDRRALAWFEIAAKDDPEDWRFWLEYAQLLERLRRRDAGLRIRRYGLNKLGRAAGRRRSGQGSVQAESGPLQTWPGAVDPTAPDRVEGGLRLRAGVMAMAGLRRWASLHPPRNWNELEIELALIQRDRAWLVRMLGRPTGPTLPPRLEAEAHAQVGRVDRALEVALEARIEDPGSFSEAELRTYLRATESGASRFRLAGEARQFGDLYALGVALEGGGAVALLKAWQAELRAAWAELDDGPGRGLGEERTAEGELSLGLVGPRADRYVRLGVHAQARAGTGANALLQGSLALQTDGGAVQLGLRLGLSDIVPETPLAYTLAARDRLQLQLGIVLDSSWSLGGAIEVEHHHDRDRRTFGFGLTASGSLRRELGTSEWGDRLSVFATGQVSVRDLRETLPASGEGTPIRTTDIIPASFGAAGLGLRLERRRPLLSLGPGHARYYLEAWLGAQWPLGELAYQLEGGGAISLWGWDELFLAGDWANLVGGFDTIQSRLQLGYRVRLSP